MIWLALGLALADEPAPTDPPAGGVEGDVLGGVEGGVQGTGAPGVPHSEVRVKHRVMPVYPDAAKQLGIEEAVCVVKFTITVEGLVSDVTALDCQRVFEESALEAARQWTFYPVLRDGVPVPAIFTLRIKYVLEEPVSGIAGEHAPTALIALDLGGGARGGGWAASAHIAVIDDGSTRWYKEASATGLVGPRHEGETVSMWREDLLIGPQVQAGPARLALASGLGLDRWAQAPSFRVPLRGTALVRASDAWMFQISGQPSWVFAGADARKRPGLIDEVAVEGRVWYAGWGDPHDYHGGLHLSGGWLDWPDQRVVYATVGVGTLNPRR